jgi:hypothetical protein
VKAFAQMELLDRDKVVNKETMPDSDAEEQIHVK